MKTVIRTVAAAAFAFALPAAAEENVTTAPGIAVDPLVSTGETIIGQPFAYPDGAPVVTAAILTITPGTETGWHTHAVPLFAYVMEGELVVDYGTEGTRAYKPGDSFMEAFEWPHNGMNNGAAPVRILTVYAGAEGIQNATPVAQ